MFLNTAILLLASAGAAQAQWREPMPYWLRDTTGMSFWPSTEPPFIPTKGINLRSVPNLPVYQEGQCGLTRPGQCSWDCNRCSSATDMLSAPELIQTFDNGPTPATLDLLHDFDGKTTFFTLGENVVRYPEVFRKAYQDGHLLATHGWSNRRLTTLSNAEIAAQLQWSIWAMNATAGIVPRFFRPPFGAIDNRVRSIAHQFGLVPVLWDLETDDEHLCDGSISIRDICARAKAWVDHLHHGIILEHDSNPATVRAALYINKLLGRQKTLADAHGIKQWYQNKMR